MGINEVKAALMVTNNLQDHEREVSCCFLEGLQPPGLSCTMPLLPAIQKYQGLNCGTPSMSLFLVENVVEGEVQRVVKELSASGVQEKGTEVEVTLVRVVATLL